MKPKASFTLSAANSSLPTPPLRKQRLSREEYFKLLQFLQQRYPLCFAISCDIPLAIGIHKQLMMIPERPFSCSQLEQILALYTRSQAYRRGLIIDTVRVNLDGTPSSKVRPEEIAFLRKKPPSKATSPR